MPLNNIEDDVWSKLLEHCFDDSLICSDSRSVKPGSIFFALRGPNFNGNTYAQQAIEHGAKLAVIDDTRYVSGQNTILVDNVLATLQALAKAYRNSLEIPVIGLTGSNGKTTTKELLHCALSGTYRTDATRGNLNNHIGVPLTILNIPRNTEIAIVEMGANAQKEIDFLCNIVQPTHGIITNIGDAHLDGFGGFEGIKKGKSELYDYIRSNNGTIFIHDLDNTLKDLSHSITTFSFGSMESDMPYTLNAANVERLELEIGTEQVKIISQLSGHYNAPNIACACAVANHFGIPLNVIANRIQAYKPTNNRSQTLNSNRNKIILDAYNANPSSVKAALNNLSKQNGNKLAILGDMMELGTFTKALHAEILELCLTLEIEVITLGPNYNQIAKDKSKSFSKFDQLISFITENPVLDQTILLKGSRKMKMERLVEYL